MTLFIRLCMTLTVFLATTGVLWAGDITGTWKLDVETDGGSGTPTFAFEQQGNKITGTYDGDFGKAEVSGTIKDDAIEFSFSTGALGKVHYKGKLTDSGVMEGTCDYGGMASGTFKGTRL